MRVRTIGRAVTRRCPRQGCWVYSRSRPRGSPPRRGGRVVECGSLENCLGGIPSYEGSNPSLSARQMVNVVPEPSQGEPGPRVLAVALLASWVMHSPPDESAGCPSIEGEGFVAKMLRIHPEKCMGCKRCE